MITANTLPAGFIYAVPNSYRIKKLWLALPRLAGHRTSKNVHPTLPRGVEVVPVYQTAWLWVAKHRSLKVKGKGHPCTDTEALYMPYGPYGE
jgi:hypothetical protein